jgi:hypothetical protein
MPAGPPPSKGRSHKVLIGAMLFAVVSVLLLCCVLAFAPTDDEGVNGQARVDTAEPVAPFAEPVDPGPEPAAESPTPSPTPAAKPKPRAVVLEAGTYEVGKRTDADAGTIAPGTYKIHTPDGGINCYWARLKNFDGELTSIRSNGNVADGKTARVTVKASDAGLELLGACEARK